MKWTFAIHLGLHPNSGMDRPAVIQTYGSVWITSVLVWIEGMESCGVRVWIGALHFDSLPFQCPSFFSLQRTAVSPSQPMPRNLRRSFSKTAQWYQSALVQLLWSVEASTATAGHTVPLLCHAETPCL